MIKVLFLGCHVDDIELGCGGTIHKKKNEWQINCLTLSQSSYSPLGMDGPYPDIWKCQRESFDFLGVQGKWLSHRTNFFYQERNELYASLNRENDITKPDIVFTQSCDDHQDHETLHKETLRVFQKSSIIEYHIPRSQRSFCPNYYQSLADENVNCKIKSLQFYDMYRNKIYFQEEFIRSQLIQNGCYIGEKYAESFRIIQLIEK